MGLTVALAAVAAYLLGAIPVGVLVARSKGVDILNTGSGNPGATNVGRALGGTWGKLVFLTDMTKGLLAALLGRVLFPEGVLGMPATASWFVLGLIAVLGHSRSPFIGFRGGKGVATAMGAGLGAIPLVALTAFAVFGVVLKTVNYMSVASIAGVWTAVLVGLVVPGAAPTVPLLALLAIYITALHRANIGRLRAGTEPRFRQKAPTPLREG